MIGATKNMGIACDCKVPVPPREEKWQMLAIEDQAIGEFFVKALSPALLLSSQFLSLGSVVMPMDSHEATILLCIFFAKLKVQYMFSSQMIPMAHCLNTS